MNGHQVARTMRETPGLEHTLLVAVTGWVPGDKRRAPEGDFDVFLLKPVELPDLQTALRTVQEQGPSPG